MTGNGFVQVARDAIESIAIGDVPRLEALLREHPDLVQASGFGDQKEGTYFHGATLLHYVAGNPTDHPVSANAGDITRALLRAGAEVDEQTTIGHNTSLCLVASGSAAREAGVQTELLEILIAAGADVNAHDVLAVYAALIHGETEAVATLHEHGGRLDLRFAAGLGEIEKMKGFFTADGGLITQARSSYRRRPYYERKIDIDCQVGSNVGDEGEVAQVNEILKLTRDQMLNEAFAYAIINRQLEAARFLLDRGADVNGMPEHPHNGGHTALHFACTSLARAPYKLVTALLDWGADPTRLDETGTGATPPQWAAHNDLPDCVAAFADFGAIDP